VTNHQVGVIAYFKQRSAMFIDWIAASKDQDVIVIDDLVQQAVCFIDEQLRFEMHQYNPKSRRYGELVDMLIEIHVIKPGEFRQSLKGAASVAFHGPTSLPS
jgi:hypothetical protein